MTLFKILTFIKFRFRATNQHGVHSPFVYRLLTKAIYPKQGPQTNKSRQILIKCIGYFKPENLQFQASDQPLKKEFSSLLSTPLEGAPPYDLVYFGSPQDPALSTKLSRPEEWHNDTLFFIDKISESKASRAYWKKLCTNEIVTVSIDFFYCGLLFFRKEQAKEHFMIRI